MKTLYIYGAPGSGKSTLARTLASDFGTRFQDLDELVAARTGMPIPDYFGRFGEAAFREVEAEMLRTADAPVVALGGGSLLRDDSRAFAEQNGFVAVLDVPEDEIARRIALAPGARPLGDKARERRAHYASFAHHVRTDSRIVLPARLSGAVVPPLSKSHLHRLLIAAFLADLASKREHGGRDLTNECIATCGGEGALAACGDDIAATRRCLAAIADALDAKRRSCSLDCGESGSTLRFLAPLAAALGLKASFIRRGRLAQRPSINYDSIAPGSLSLPGNISSQFVTGLMFALPLLDGKSEIHFTSPLESLGYVNLTRAVLRSFGVQIRDTPDGYEIPAPQNYTAPLASPRPERDWSAAAFWHAARALGANVTPAGLDHDSAQPDRAVEFLIEKIAAGNASIDISQSPDLYPALAVVAAATPGTTRFTNAARLRIKESDRIAAMESVLCALGAKAESSADASAVTGSQTPFLACEIDSLGDHRIAMSAAIAAIKADGPVLIHNASCVAKSYPRFFDDYLSLASNNS